MEQRWLEGLDAYEEVVSGGAAHHTRSRLTLLCQTAAGTSVPPRPRSCAAACTRGSVRVPTYAPYASLPTSHSKAKPPYLLLPCQVAVHVVDAGAHHLGHESALAGVSSVVCAHTW